jgi:hypothetical protein
MHYILIFKVHTKRFENIYIYIYFKDIKNHRKWDTTICLEGDDLFANNQKITNNCQDCGQVLALADLIKVTILVCESCSNFIFYRPSCIYSSHIISVAMAETADFKVRGGGEGVLFSNYISKAP